MTRIPKITAGIAVFVLLACGSAGAAEKVCLTGKDFSAWGNSADWSIAGDAFLHPNNENLLSVTPGTGVIVNGRRGNSPPLVSNMQFGDVRAHIEFAVPKKTNAGIYFQGRYKLNICDGWGEANGLSPGLQCGGIYPRWDDSRTLKAYEGHSPQVNACRPTGQWQSFDVIFRAPRFDKNGRKIANACFVKVIHNGIVIHEDAEMGGPTRDSPLSDESARGPIALQGDHGPIAFRNIWAMPIELDKMRLMNPFFAMDTGTIDETHKSAKEQAEMLKELGYSGIGYWERNLSHGTKGLQDILNEMDNCGLKAYAVYFTITLEEPKERYLPLIEDSIKLLDGREAIIWLAITSEHYRKSSSAGDEKAAAIISEIADVAHKHDVSVALYPHAEFWLEKIEDAVRVAQKVNRRNVGVTFNLYHWLRTDRLANMESAIDKAMPYLFVVTINGTTEAGSIETLDRGTFDVYSFLKTLRQHGFKGPIGLQGYGIGADVHENLRRSMEAWRGFSQRLATEEAERIDY